MSKKPTREKVFALFVDQDCIENDSSCSESEDETLIDRASARREKIELKKEPEFKRQHQYGGALKSIIEKYEAESKESPVKVRRLIKGKRRIVKDNQDVQKSQSEEINEYEMNKECLNVDNRTKQVQEMKQYWNDVTLEDIEA